MEKPIFNLVSFSGGKDSTAMLLRMIEEGIPIDCILFCDTGLEFPAMYDHIAQVERDIGREITIVSATDSFEYLMFEKPINRKVDSKFSRKYGLNHTGYGWAGPKMRWCTNLLKNTPREKFLREIRKNYTVKEYVGLAADEGYRLERPTNQNPNHVHPLIDWGMTEADCLQYCYDRGYTWGGLYDHFKRVSCWCCPLQSLEELRNLHKYHPDLWEKLKDWDQRTWRNFRADYGVEDLEVRFALEQKWQDAGKDIRSRAFFEELRKHMGRDTNEQSDTGQSV